jgi:hypothetical protein
MVGNARRQPWQELIGSESHPLRHPPPLALPIQLVAANYGVMAHGRGRLLTKVM